MLRFVRTILQHFYRMACSCIAWIMNKIRAFFQYMFGRNNGDDETPNYGGRSGMVVDEDTSLRNRYLDLPRSYLTGESERETSEDFICDYDSTWDSDDEIRGDKERGRVRSRWSNSQRFQQFRTAAKDMQEYRRNYPNKPHRFQDRKDKPNLAFYRGEIPSSPDGIYIKDFHEFWRRDYGKLESTHTFIQWLFPLQEPGLNPRATEMTKEEINEFLKDRKAKANLVESYKLMLDFYGITLLNEETGEVKKATNSMARFANLNRNTHNNLRITRILKCLGTLGFPHYQARLVEFFLEETLVGDKLPNVKYSVLNYFIFTVLDKQKRKELINFAFSMLNSKEEFVWCPKKIQRRWLAKEGGNK